MTVWYLIVAYLIGSIPFGWLVGKARGIDLLTKGSGSTGATNVKRYLGWKPALLVFAYDILKGVAATLNVLYLSGDVLWAGLGGVVALLGHCYPIWLAPVRPFGLKSAGKAVASTLGITIVIQPISALLSFGVFLLVLLRWRLLSLGSLAGVVTMTAIQFTVDEPLAIRALIVAMGALIVWRHRENIDRLIKKKENRFNFKSVPTLVGKEHSHLEGEVPTTEELASRVS